MQQQTTAASSGSYYNLENRLVVQESSLFKLLKYDDEHIIFTAPDAKCVAVVHKATLDSETIRKIYCHDKPSSLDLLQVAGRKIVIVGGHRGAINVKMMAQSDHDDEESTTQKLKVDQEWFFKPEAADEIYANDIAHWPSNPNVLANCFNNGTVAIWGLVNQKRLHTFKRVHEKYLYKVRFQTESILVSCGFDATVMRTDLEKQTQISMFSHVLPVWGVYPIDCNQIASVGLFGRVLVWDVRSNSIVQACNNDSGQSSFITGKEHEHHNLYYGDSNLLLRWDRRKHRPLKISRSMMLVSAEALLFDDDCLYACGRGKDLVKFKSSHTLQDSAHVFEYLRTELVLLAESHQNQQNLQNQQNQQISDESDADDGEWQTESEGSNEQDSSMVEQEKQPLIKNKPKQQKQTVTIISALKIDLDNIREYAEHERRLQTESYEQDEISEEEEQLWRVKQQDIMMRASSLKNNEFAQQKQTETRSRKQIQSYVKPQPTDAQNKSDNSNIHDSKHMDA